MPTPVVPSAGRRAGSAQDWARAEAIVQAEYGTLPEAQRYRLVTAVYKKIRKGHQKHEATLSGATGGFRDSSAAVVVAGRPAPGRYRPREKKPVRESVEHVVEEMPFGNVMNFFPGWDAVSQDNAPGYIADDPGTETPPAETWHATTIPKGTRFNQPAGTAVIKGKRYNVYRGKGKLHAVPEALLRAEPHAAVRESIVPRGLNESADDPLLTPEQTAKRPNVIRTCRDIRDRAKSEGKPFEAFLDKLLDDYEASYDTPEKRATFPALSNTVAHMRQAYRIAHSNLREAVEVPPTSYTPQALAVALSKAGIPLASRGERHEVSGVQVLKVGDRVGWRWQDHAGTGDRVHGELQVVAALDILGFRTMELRPGDGSWIILPPA